MRKTKQFLGFAIMVTLIILVAVGSLLSYAAARGNIFP